MGASTHRDINILQISVLRSDSLAELITESDASGQAFVRGLVVEWEWGANRFSQPGEALFVAMASERVVGVCGLNVDPYQDSQKIGRVRRLYVL